MEEQFYITIKELKNRYDLKLKELVGNDDLFDKEYPVYFNKAVFNEMIINKLGEHKEAYAKGAGDELNQHTRNGKVIPPSMASVASSSRFCCFSLKDSDLSVFGIKNKDHPISFEEILPIYNKYRGTPPHMDAYYENDSDCYFFECKCHEPFDYHIIKLSPDYFKKDRIVTKIDKKYYLEPSYYGQTIIDPKAFGLDENPRFDVKQFLTHIMGIQNRMATKKGKKAHLIYFYFIPDKVREDKEINEIIEQLLAETKILFNHEFFKQNAKEIEFSLYIMHSDVVEPANCNNTRKINIGEKAYE